MGYLHTIAVENTNAKGLDMLVEKMTRVEMEAQVVAEKSLYEAGLIVKSGVRGGSTTWKVV